MNRGTGETNVYPKLQYGYYGTHTQKRFTFWKGMLKISRIEVLHALKAFSAITCSVYMQATHNNSDYMNIKSFLKGLGITFLCSYLSHSYEATSMEIKVKNMLICIRNSFHIALNFCYYYH